MKIEPKPIVVFFDDELSRLMSVLAVAAGDNSRSSAEIMEWATEQYRMLETFQNNRD